MLWAPVTYETFAFQLCGPCLLSKKLSRPRYVKPATGTRVPVVRPPRHGDASVHARALCSVTGIRLVAPPGGSIQPQRLMYVEYPASSSRRLVCGRVHVSC